MSRPVGPVLGLYPSGTDTGSSDPYWGVEEQIVSSPVPLMIGIALPQNPMNLTSRGNPASYVQDDGRNNKSPVSPDWEP